MASTYSPLKIELIGTGEQAGTWGVTTNTNLGTALEEAITGSANVSFSSSDVTLTLTDTNAAQTGRNLRLNLTGTSGGARNLILGSGMQIEKLYLINNGLADAVTVKNTTGTGIAVPAGKSMFVFNNGTNVVDAITHLSSLTLGSALPIASGGTGTTSTTFVNLATNVTGDLPFANLTQIAGLSVLGVTGNSTADVAGITAGTDNQVLRRSGTSVAFGAVNLASTDAVTGDLPFSNLAQGAALSVLGVTGNAIADVASIAAGSDHQVLRRSGTSVGFGAVNLAQSAAITGTLPVTNGGTGITAFGTGVATWLGTPSSANLAAAVTDETGSGSLVFATSPTLVTPTLGVATATSINKVTFTAPATSATLTIANGKTLTANNSLTLAGTDATTMTFPSTSQTIAGLGVAQTFTAAQTFRAANAIRSEAASTQDAIVIAGRAGGTNSRAVTIVPTTLGANRTLTLPDATTTVVGTDATQTLTNKTLGATTLSGTLSVADNLVDRPTLKDYAIEGQAVGNTGGTRTLDLNDANFFSATLDQACTFTFADPPASGDFGCFVLELTNGGAFAITWPAAVDWPGGAAPSLTASGKDQLVFTTRDAGTTWFGFVAGYDIK